MKHPILEYMERNGVDTSRYFITDTGQELIVHPELECSGPPCPVHSPSERAKAIGKTHWRGDRAIMERVCEHGVGHPDPDDVRVRTVKSEGIHGCDGCCTP